MTALPLESQKLSTGRELVFLRAGLARGRNLLVRHGFAQSQNPDYWKRGDEVLHYNRLMRVWLYETTAARA